MTTGMNIEMSEFFWLVGTSPLPFFVWLCRMDASLVNVFVSELVKFKTGGHYESTNAAEKPQQLKAEDEDNIPKLTEDELIQLQDQMRKVHRCSYH